MRGSAGEALGGIGHPDAVPGLVRRLGDAEEIILMDDSDDLTREAIDRLIDENHPDLQEILAEALEHPWRQVRIHAACKLAELFQDVRALPGLHEALYSGDRRLQKVAADAVWGIGDADAPGLIRALHFERGAVRDAIVAALDLVGWFPDNVNSEVTYRIATRNWRDVIPIGAPAVSGLVSALSDPDGNVRRGAAWTLGQIADARAVPFLIDMLGDTAGDMFGIGERVCDAVAEALERIGTSEAFAAVREWQANQSNDDRAI